MKKLFYDTTNERRVSTLKYSYFYKKKLKFYRDAWGILIYPRKLDGYRRFIWASLIDTPLGFILRYVHKRNQMKKDTVQNKISRTRLAFAEILNYRIPLGPLRLD